MRRRSLLAALALGSAGCLGRARPAPESTPGGGSDSDADTTRSPDTDPATVDPAAQTTLDSHPADESPVGTVTVGDGPPSGDVRPHAVAVWNDGSERSVATTVRAEGAGIDVSRTHELRGGQFVRFELTERVRYDVTAGVEGERRYRFQLRESVVDCNHSQTTVRVPPSGQVEYATVSTTIACSTGFGLSQTETSGR